MQVLGLHMENDHAYNFQCAECGGKFPFKNQLKLHRREVHEEGTFSCFVCNKKFKTHKELKLHIQKKCKTGNVSHQAPIMHKHNEDILEEDEHKCPMCPKICNNQVSLIYHINMKHKSTSEKCDSCEKDFETKEVLIKHIVEHHTKKGHQIIPRHICQICNVEVHGDATRDNHQCRKPQHTCSFCKVDFYSNEARKNHICSDHEFQTVAEQIRAQKRKQTECTHGPNCYRAQRNRCWFKHSQPINVLPHRVQVPGDQQGQVQQASRQGHNQRDQEQQRQGQQRQGQLGQGQQGQEQEQRRKNTECRRGSSCFRLANNTCWFKHSEVLNISPQQGHVQTQPALWCQLQDQCTNASCTYRHFGQGFPQRNLSRSQQ